MCYMCQLVQAITKISKRDKCLQITSYYAKKKKKKQLGISVFQCTAHTFHVQCCGTYDLVQNVDFNVVLVCSSSIDSNQKCF
jgi:hypothetical protein